MPNTSPPTDQDHPSRKRRGRTRRGRRGGRKNRRTEPAAEPPALSGTPASPDLDIGIVFAERSEQPARAPLLDAAAARRLAADARRREQASREALEATRRAMHLDVERYATVAGELRNEEAARIAEPAPASAPPPDSEASATDSSALPETEAKAPRAESSGWQRVPLQPMTPTEDLSPKESAAKQLGPRPAERVEAAPAERNLELESTLAIARETALAQRAELAELRQELESRDLRIAGLETALETSSTAAAKAVEEERVAMRTTLEQAQREIETLRERLALEDRAQKTLDAERRLLEQKLEAKESALAERRTQIEELRDRLEAQEEALHAARREYESERSRHSESLHVLSRLRSMLTDLPAAATPDRSESTDAQPGDPDCARSDLEATQDAAPPAVRVASVEPCLPVEQEASSAPDPMETLSTAVASCDAQADAMLPPIFDAWQDDQIRRQFGPMGIDSFSDLLRVPLARSEGDRSSEQAILLIGRGAAEVAGAIAEGLVRHEIGAFHVHVADPRGEHALETVGLPRDSPLHEFVTPIAFPHDPESLAATLESLRPRAIVSRDFLSREADVAPWLACFERATTRGASLIFSEGTGTASVTPPPEVAQVGERIWELMPERYTRQPGTDRRIEHWREAFEAREAARPNELVTALRERFTLEMFTQFGFLAEPFLASAIGWNFDPEAPRDRRFLGQVADLDDRRIEAGLVPALHLVALVDPLASD